MAELEKKKPDSRGYLVEFMKASELPAGMKEFSQIYVTTMTPGAVRGNHYHKNRYEWFAIFNGRVLVVLEDVNTKERKEIMLDDSGDKLKRVRIRNSVAHAFKNVSDTKVVLVAYTDRVYDPSAPDTYEYKLL